MKTLYLVRHAKSSWAEPGATDFERPLNDRGKRDAADMGKRLKLREIHFDSIISSPALRAEKTALLFAREMGYDTEAIIWDKDLYLAAPETILNTISKVPDTVNSLAIFCHNPGITELANTLSSVRVDNMSTGSVYAVSYAGESWKEFEKASPRFLFFDYPKSR